MDELEIKDLNLSHELFYTINLKDTRQLNRIDSEYYQPKYESIEKILNKFKTIQLAQACSLINYGTVPTSPYVERGVPYIKGLNLVNCFIYENQLDFLDIESTKKLPAKFYVKEKDIIISQMGTVGKAGIVEKEQEGWLFASFTIRLRLKKDCGINPYFLTLFIEKVSRPYYLLRRIAQASIRQNTDLPTVRDLKVPLIQRGKQEKIAEKLIQSHDTRKQAKKLLEDAKKKVEDLIERKG